MLIGIAGTHGAGKGEKGILGPFARGCQVFLELAIRNSDNLNSACRAPAPSEHGMLLKLKSVC